MPRCACRPQAEAPVLPPRRKTHFCFSSTDLCAREEVLNPVDPMDWGRPARMQGRCLERGSQGTALPGEGMQIDTCTHHAVGVGVLGGRACACTCGRLRGDKPTIRGHAYSSLLEHPAAPGAAASTFFKALGKPVAFETHFAFITRYHCSVLWQRALAAHGSLQGA